MSQIVMRCATPVMTAGGVQRYKPGDFLPVGHPDSQGWEWVEFIAADDADFAEAVSEAVIEPDPVPTPEPVEPEPEPVKVESAPVDF